MKTVIIFVFGLLSWLLLTNFQLVYSQITHIAKPGQGYEEVLASSDEITRTPHVQASGKDLSASDALLKTQNEDDVVKSEFPDNTTALEVTNNDSLTDVYDETLPSETLLPTVPETRIGTTTSQQPLTHPWMFPNSAMPAFHPNVMNHGMFMNPMTMMMSMMGPMMNHPVNILTHPQNMNAMMMAMDPNLMFSMFGQPSKEYLDGEVPDHLPVVKIPGMPTQAYQFWPKNKLSPGVSREAKKNAFQTAMALSPLSMRDMMGIMAEKIPVDEGVSWDDAVEAMKLRANEVNFKFVGSSPLWKEIEAVTGKPSAKVEMFRFCDAEVARNILDAVPEFIVFLPCKIALLEDGEGQLWVMTMDWDVSWLDYAQNPNSHLTKSIREDAQRIRENLHYIMEGAATGDF